MNFSKMRGSLWRLCGGWKAWPWKCALPIGTLKNLKNIKSEHRGQARMPQKGLAMKMCISLRKSKKSKKTRKSEHKWQARMPHKTS